MFTARKAYDDYIKILKREADYMAIVQYAIEKIQVPSGRNVNVTIQPAWIEKHCVVWLEGDSWPTEMVCGFVAELEELIGATAKMESSMGFRVAHTFHEGTDMEFQVACNNVIGCKWVGEPTKYGDEHIICE